MNYESAREREAQAIAKRLEAACGLDVTPNAVEAIEEGLEAMRTEKDLRLASNALVETQKKRELEIWRQAYNAALTGIIADNERHDPNEYAKHTADQALADYLAKREEMLK